ncbi:3'-5' exonuclease [Longibacter salinarum]|uniref:3'-5' exonuclease n=1 Tax=Longibacter salinarum TaxID=1850348 RepID=UPI0015CF3537|nr:3'-5' exonuclease [Longibacter salinarum]
MAPLRFLDIETSGLRADRGARITEIALLSDRDVKLDWCYDECGEIGSEAHDVAVHSQLAHLVRGMSETVIVAHNAPFDLKFIAYEARRLGVRGLDVRVIDTLALSRRLHPDLRNHRLETLAEAFGLSAPGPFHTAMTDANVTRSLFQHLQTDGALDTLGDAGIRRLRWSEPME